MKSVTVRAREVKRTFLSAIFLLVVIGVASPIWGSAPVKKEASKTAIVVAGFGTTVVDALPGITNIVDEVRRAYPQTEVRLCFTSNIIRKVWRKRQQEPAKWLAQSVPEEILYVKNIISVLGDLREEGYRNIIVQPTHMFFMEQSYDLLQYVTAIDSIQTKKDRWKPFDHVVMGRPALGAPEHSVNYLKDVDYAVTTLADDVKYAQEKDAALVYMGHGNEHWASPIYDDTSAAMNKFYPSVRTEIGVVEGEPSVEHVIDRLKALGVTDVVLKPFMIVAGDHAVNDMAGDDSDSWKSRLEKEGFEVETILKGLGENKKFAGIFVKHIADVAAEHQMNLK